MREQKDTSPISSFLITMRKEQGLTMEYAEGLCTRGELSKIEKGDHIPSKMLLEALVERLGGSLEQLGVIYSKTGYELEGQKRMIQEFLSHGALEEARQQSQKLEQRVLQEKESVSKFWKQFFAHVNLCLQLEAGIPAESLKEGTLEAIWLTAPYFPHQITKMTRYDKEELSLLSFYGELLWQEGKQEESLRLYQYLCDYAWEKIPEQIEQAKVYSGLLLILAQKKYAAGQETDGIYYSIVKLLREAHRSYFLTGWLRMREQSGQLNIERKFHTADEALASRGMEVPPGSQEFQKAEKDVWALFGQMEQRGTGSECQTCAEGIYLFWQEEGHKSYADYQFFSLCQQKGVTKGMLVRAKVVTSHTLSRLAQGERVHQSTYQLLMEQLGAEGEYYQPILKTNDFSLFQVRREVRLYMEQKNFQAAEERLEFLKRRLDQGEAVNRQVILLYQAILDKRRRRKEKESLKADLEEALYLTIPRECDIEHYPLSHIEIRILNQIACLENEFGNTEEAIRGLRSIVASYQNNPMGKEADLSGYFLVMSNLVNYLGDVGEYEEAISYSEEILQDAYHMGVAYSLIEALYDKAWCIKRLYSERDTREACLMELRQAFSLAVLIDYRYMRNLIEDYVKKEYQVSFEEWLKEE